jgi:hypothetical protein
MKKKLLVPLVMVVGLSLVSLSPATAKAPLIGEMDLQFNLGFPGPQEVIPDFVGTIELDGEVYGMAFFAIGSGKPFSGDPSSSVHFFEEIWKIYEDLDYLFDENGVLVEFVEGPVLLWGYDTGSTVLANSRYHMNGGVEGAAEPFEGWLGRSVHMQGIIEWYPFGAPKGAPGTFRIN